MCFSTGVRLHRRNANGPRSPTQQRELPLILRVHNPLKQVGAHQPLGITRQNIPLFSLTPRAPRDNILAMLQKIPQSRLLFGTSVLICLSALTYVVLRKHNAERRLSSVPVYTAKGGLRLKSVYDGLTVTKPQKAFFQTVVAVQQRGVHPGCGVGYPPASKKTGWAQSVKSTLESLSLSLRFPFVVHAQGGGCSSDLVSSPCTSNGCTEAQYDCVGVDSFNCDRCVRGTTGGDPPCNYCQDDDVENNRSCGDPYNCCIAGGGDECSCDPLCGYGGCGGCGGGCYLFGG